MSKHDFPFTDHLDMTTLALLSHSYSLQNGQHNIEYHFSDGKVLADKLPPDCSRSMLANHLLQLVDSLRAMDSIPDPPMDDE